MGVELKLGLHFVLSYTLVKLVTVSCTVVTLDSDNNKTTDRETDILWRGGGE